MWSYCYLLTLRNVALSLVTMDGFTLMLSCMIDVKLQKDIGGKMMLTVASIKDWGQVVHITCQLTAKQKKGPQRSALWSGPPLWC